MTLITNTYDLLRVIVGIIGIILMGVQLYLYDFDIVTLFLGEVIEEDEL